MILVIPCKCGHAEQKHKPYIQPMEQYCDSCWGTDNPMTTFHRFQSDNLSYIEKLAKQKGLV